MKVLAGINPENVDTKKLDGWRERRAARAILFDAAGKIALLHVTKHHYHKLPGGGY